MQGVQHVVESRGIGDNVHLPSVALKAFVGGSHGHCWVELRYLLRQLLKTVSTCRWVKARSGWFESSWSKRHMLTRADVRPWRNDLNGSAIHSRVSNLTFWTCEANLLILLSTAPLYRLTVVYIDFLSMCSLD